jgi:hypothetical protein
MMFSPAPDFYLFSVMAGLVPAIHVFLAFGEKTWMPGTRPGMTNNSHRSLT